MGLASEPRMTHTATTRTTTASPSPPIASPRLRFSRRLASSRSLSASARAFSRLSALVSRGLLLDIALPQGSARGGRTPRQHGTASSTGYGAAKQVDLHVRWELLSSASAAAERLR